MREEAKLGCELTGIVCEDAPASKRWARINPVVATCLLMLTGLPFIFFATFSGIPAYGDEGTLMLTFRQLLNGGILYHNHFELYGPFYYFVFRPIFSLFHVPLSHDSARLITAFLWICCNVTYATLMWRLTGSAITRAFTLLVTLFILEEFGTSALHPQELIFLMIGVLLHLVVEIEKRKSAPVTFLAVGAIVGGLLLTKINLAAFIILPLLLAALRTTSNENLWRRIRPAALAAGLLMSVILMAPLLRFEWVNRYCVFAEGTIIAAFFVWSSMSIPKIFSVRDWGFAIGGCAMVMLLIISATMAGGSTASEILNATILQNFRFATNWYRPTPINSGVIPVTAVSTIIAMLYALSRTRAVNTKAEIGLVIAALKTGIGCLGCMAIVVAAFFRTPWLFLPPIMFQSVVPFSWLLMVTDQNAAEPRPFARATLGLMAAFLSLYSFPVSGTQTALASLLPTIMLPVLLNDGSRHPDIQRFLKGWLPAALRTELARLAGIGDGVHVDAGNAGQPDDVGT